ncbi:hypothetical protein FOPG_13013 [Fusarium oxysporum f. sp. conglutinans race 2 54008]|uniref:Transmembrane protein n=2 Tax=Fusarium oxysporum f. sp. conglutinans TaxID=100902 RepID=A0A8H6G977_FUSOX|nr:hypothetical protein FOPG_13013 [Fusarium oxysporum f. sp. conglutinans race 2 54008]KAF6513400.1 hypothetical protein HZS61_006725 [Fusarium oxysporum f. sp. conglutinans]KAG7003348.1 Transmembrane protein [Fusarium oxysporum f. sp. conglutinans]KAI8398943.1 hypothetical protein FOFC_20170 [Fusarium oxysporum]
MGLFRSGDDDKSNVTCPTYSFAQDAEKNITGSLSFYQLSMIIGGSFAAFALIVMFFINMMHATHLSNPSEQVKIMRIGTLISAFSIISFLCICFPHAAVYIEPWLHVYEGFALGSFFLLLCDYVSPNRDQQDVFFATKKKNGIKWFKTRWIMIFQMPVIAIGVAVATDITQAAGIFCQESNDRHFANIYLRIIMSVSLVISVLSILQMYFLLKKDLAHHNPMLKLTAFKIVVGLTFIQGIIFTVLNDQNVLKTSDTLTYADVHVGIPNLVICIEMAPLSLFLMFAYPWSVYMSGHGRGNFSKLEQGNMPEGSYQGGPFGIHAWLAMLNPSDSIKAILFIFKQDNRNASTTSVNMTGYQSNDPLVSHPYNPQPYSTTN